MKKNNHPLPQFPSPEEINDANIGTLMETLGIEYTHISAGRAEAMMLVEKRVCQSFGILHGGATLALAETVAGQGSLVLCDEGEVPVGIQVSGNHISSARKGETVLAVGTILQQGHSVHVWNVDITADDGRMISSVRVVNSILKKE